jgi:sugar lactone lactonase YvrE
MRAFGVLPNGLLAKQTERLVSALRGSGPGGPDGMKVDAACNIYCGGSGRIDILRPTGKKARPRRSRLFCAPCRTMAARRVGSTLLRAADGNATVVRHANKRPTGPAHPPPIRFREGSLAMPMQ